MNGQENGRGIYSPCSVGLHLLGVIEWRASAKGIHSTFSSNMLSVRIFNIKAASSCLNMKAGLLHLHQMSASIT